LNSVKKSGSILLESVPLGVSLEDVKHDLEKVSPSLPLKLPLTNKPQVSGALSIHELHVWRLSQHKALASTHVFTTDDSLANFMVRAKLINECLHAYGIHSSTLQPELVTSIEEAGREVAVEEARRRNVAKSGCQISCGALCENLTCCGREKFEAVTRAVAVAGLHS
jgi:zinc transporter 1